MAEPTKSDVRLLRAIETLTTAQSGQPPTLAELAEGLGLQSGSRANIHRQLTKLKNRYVRWDASPRSLRLTNAGMALIGVAPLSTHDPDVEFAAADEIVPLLASGLTKICHDVQEGVPLRAPYPVAWQRGLNMLAAECIVRGIKPPSSTMEALQWCRRPIDQWPLRFTGISSGILYGMDSALLDDDMPSELCRDLAIAKGDAETELGERLMLNILRETKARRQPEVYAAIRQYIIEHPVVPLEDLLGATFEFGNVGAELNNIYEQVPETAIHTGKIKRCGHCGWTLERKPNGVLRCGDTRCSVLTANFTKGSQEIPAKKGLLRVCRAIRRYIVAPGTYELDAATRIRALGVECLLWPWFDSYDLRIVFANGEVWAVDVKDWTHAFRLAKKLFRIEAPLGYEYDRAIYAVPDERLTDGGEYLTVLRNRRTTEGIDIISIGDLVAAVKARARGEEKTNG